MKLATLGALTAAVGLGVLVADRPGAPGTAVTTSYPPGCAISVEGAGHYLPRAGLTIENRGAGPARAWLEPRHGLPRVDLGVVAGGESRWLAHALPAGRNMLTATAGEGRTVRSVLAVINRGVATCARRYLWRIE
jgi:hypothetical protein